MKSVTFIRHAKSSWEFNVPDRERPLNKRGTNDAILTATYFKSLDVLHDLIIASPAQRTLATYDIFNHILNTETITFQIFESLYDFEGSGVRNTLLNLDDDFNSVMVFGHNFALTSLANTLSFSNIQHVPTCGLYKIEFDISCWKDLKQGQLTHFITPKQLK